MVSVYINFARARVILEERSSVEKMILPHWPVGKPVVLFFTDGMGGLTLPGAVPPQGVLCSMVEPATESKPESNAPL